jgi:hypothetical protein
MKLGIKIWQIRKQLVSLIYGRQTNDDDEKLPYSWNDGNVER